jgi:hypothetical protein
VYVLLLNNTFPYIVLNKRMYHSQVPLTSSIIIFFVRFDDENTVSFNNFQNLKIWLEYLTVLTEPNTLYHLVSYIVL